MPTPDQNRFAMPALLVAAVVVGALVTFGMRAGVDQARDLVSGGSDGAARTGAAAKPADWVDQHPLAGTFRGDDTTVEDCASKAGRAGRTELECREQALGNIALRQGPDAAFARIDALVAGKDGASWRSDAHLIQHIIGSATLAREDGSTGKAFALGTRSNATAGSGGYYHGILLRAIRGVKTDQLGRRADELCRDPSVRADGFLTYQCLHGMGHGLMIHTGNALPVALETCSQIQAGPDQFSCYTGAFMENVHRFMGVNSGKPSRYVSDEDLLYPCTWVDERFKRACYVQATTRMGAGVRWNWRSIAEQCRKADEGYVQTCFYSTGGWAWAHAKGDHLGMQQRCADLREGNGACVYATSAWIMGNSDLSGAESIAFCRSLPAAALADCYGGIGSVVRQQGPQKHRALCGKVPVAYGGACMSPRSY